MKLTPISTVSGCPACVPDDRAKTKITLDWLLEKQACQAGREKFAAVFPKGCTYVTLRKKVAEEKSMYYENWICSVLGGDTATAGEGGTATAGYRGTATAGEGGTATAADYGTATAGYRGTATAGYRGTATAGEGGIIQLHFWDGNRKRIITGYVGENGILPGVPYKLDDKGNIIPA